MSPFFLGGEVIRGSFPTDEMTHEEKRMSMRGNNTHFSRATVHHELIPGHHLQGFMTDRYNSHRYLFGTPFWTEGWAPLLGDAALGPRLSVDARGPRRDALLADAPGRPNHLLAELPPGGDDAGRGDRLPCRPGRARARQRHRRGAPLVQRQLLAALPGRVPCSAACRSAHCTRSWWAAVG